MNKVVHFELPADDLARARKFYEGVFGWASTAIPEMNYTLVQTTPSNEQGVPTEPGGINGGMTDRTGPVQSPVITIDVDDIDEAGRKVEAAGGAIKQPKIAVGDMGFSAYFEDPEGNLIGLWQDAQK